MKIITRVLSMAMLVGLIVIGTSTVASAHHTIVTVETNCTDEGGWEAHWTISNSESDMLMTVSEQVGAIFTPNPVPFNGLATSVTSHPSSLHTVTISGHVSWPDWVTDNYNTKVYKPEGCVVVTTTTQPTTTTTTEPVVTVPPTTSTTSPTTTSTLPTTTTFTAPTTTTQAPTTTAVVVDVPELAHTGATTIPALIALGTGLLFGGLILRKKSIRS